MVFGVPGRTAGAMEIFLTIWAGAMGPEGHAEFWADPRVLALVL